VTLAAIVLVAVRGLVDINGLRRLRRLSQREFRIAIVALIGVLVLGILKGVLFAAIVSLILVLAGAARPHIAFLGRIPGTSRYSDLARHPDNESLPGIVIFRVESSLLYFNIDHVRRATWERILAAPELRLVICDLSGAPIVDLAGADMLSDLHRDLAKRGARLRIVGAHGRTRDLLRAAGLEERSGYFGRHITIEQAILESATDATAVATETGV
jgi:MFS superfamily sulfate permease-like transporter